jgi:hypothetical protein
MPWPQKLVDGQERIHQHKILIANNVLGRYHARELGLRKPIASATAELDDATHAKIETERARSEHAIGASSDSQRSVLNLLPTGVADRLLKPALGWRCPRERSS